MKNIALAALGALALICSGCATKRYGRLTSLSTAEMGGYDCRDIDIEISKAEKFIEEVRASDKIDALSIAGFLGDFGIGNAMERDEALTSATKRLAELRALRIRRGCK